MLRRLGVGAGERVYVLTGRIPELYVAALGTLKNRSVFCPLFSAFGPEPIRARLEIGDARALVTTPLLYQTKDRRARPSPCPDCAMCCWWGGAMRNPESRARSISPNC